MDDVKDSFGNRQEVHREDSDRLLPGGIEKEVTIGR
jgi:hypothetical protein